MTKLTPIMMGLIKSAVLGQPLSSDFEVPSEEIVGELYKLSKFHDIANIVGTSLVDNNLVKSAELREKFQKEIMLSIYREKQISAELNSISEVLSGAGIAFMPLKGAVIRPLYAKPWLRTSCDIDILVRESELEGAISKLTKKLGYTTDGKKNFHDVSLYSPSGVHLELHFNIKEVNDKMDPILDKVWEYSAPVCEGDFEYRQSREFLIFHIFAHTVHHFSTGGCGIRPFIDLHFLTSGDYNKEALIQLCSSAGIEKFRQGAEELISAWFRGGEYTDRARSMERYVVDGGTYGTLNQGVLAEQTSSGGRKNYLLKRIFLSYDMLKIRYPKLENRRILVPFYQVRRWVELLFGNRLGAVVKEYNRSKNITKEESEKTKELFESLGI